MLSVIVPIYNAEKYLDECIRSILEQSFRDIELILIDDGSTDKSLQICEAYAAKDSRVRVLKQSNGGVSAARNAGLAAAKGEWLSFCDCDDYLLPGFYETLFALSLQDADILVCSVAEEQADGSIRAAQNGTLRELSGREALYELFTNMGAAAEHRETIWFSVWNKIYKRELFDGVRFLSETDGSEDLPVNLAIFSKAKKLIYIEKPFYFWRYRAESQSNLHQVKALLAGTKASEIMLKYAGSLSKAQKRAGAAAAFRHFYWYYSACLHEEWRAEDADKKREYALLANDLRARLCSMKKNAAYKELAPSFKIAVVLMLYFPSLFGLLWRFLKSLRRKAKPERRSR